MSVALSGLEVIGAEILTRSGKRFDFSSGINTIDYFEDILSPCCTMRINIQISVRMVNSLPIRGGEKVVLKLQTSSGIVDSCLLYTSDAADE